MRSEIARMTFGMALSLASAVPICAAQTPLTTERVATGLARPVFVTAPAGDSSRLFIVEQHTGRIKIMDLGSGTINVTPYLDIGGIATGNEQGLLGLAFDPDYATNGFFYINYTASTRATWVVRYSVSANPDVADPASAHTILTFAQPQTNHNGGWIGFGPNDGLLYIASGDGGGGGDTGSGHTSGTGNAQDITNNLLGKMLRVDPDGDDFPADPNKNYVVPGTNPFVGVTGDDEIWAYGLRNPWRNSFDRATGDLLIGDVGQSELEEINFQPAESVGGESYGWRCFEGNQAFNTGSCPPQSTMVFPIHEYSHSFGCSVTGGYVYRGCAVPDLQGTYFFADYCSRRIWSFRYDAARGAVIEFTDRTAELAPSGASISSISSFGEDANGEIYICDLSGGEIFKIIPDGVAPVLCTCYADCDQSTGAGVLDIFDFLCFQDSFVNGEPYACDCDTDTGVGVCDIFDFLCFQDAYAGGCP